MVLILVVEEDGLVQKYRFRVFRNKKEVLILVVVEDALVPLQDISKMLNIARLNPCCSGRCSRTYVKFVADDPKLISLNPCCSGRCSRTTISITREFQPAGLNPCCSGRCSRTSLG